MLYIRVSNLLFLIVISLVMHSNELILADLLLMNLTKPFMSRNSVSEMIRFENQGVPKLSWRWLYSIPLNDELLKLVQNLITFLL